jgi:hypothetical protein
MFMDVGHEGQNILNYSPNLICSSWMCNFAHGYTNLLTCPSLSLHAVYISLSKLPSSTYTLTFIFYLCVHFTVPICSPFHTFTPRTTPEKPHIWGYVRLFQCSICYRCQAVAILFFYISRHNGLLQRDRTFYEDLSVCLWFIYRLCQYWWLDC